MLLPSRLSWQLLLQNHCCCCHADLLKLRPCDVQVQNELMQGMWSREELALPNCQPEIGPDGNLLW